MSYLGQTQKEITLPSGANVTVRRQTKLEAILIGQPPSSFLKRWKAEEKAEAVKEKDAAEYERLLALVPETTPEKDQELAKFIATQTRILLTRCCITPLTIGGETLVIADKEPGKTEASEISWALVNDDDVSAIIGAINDLSGAKRAGGEAVAATFQAETK
jgi:hypothetical protein